MVPNWLKERYRALQERFGDTSFSLEEASEVLRERFQDERAEINVVLSELRKEGLVQVDFDPQDARKRVYRLLSEREFIAQKLPLPQVPTRGEIERLLKSAADLIRTRVDYTFILILLFYKRICDRWAAEFEEEYRAALEDGLSEEEARSEAKKAVYHDFDIPEDFLWENIRKDPERIPENFSKAMKILAERNPDFRNIFESADFVQFAQSRENAEILRQLVELFSRTSLAGVASDILGDAYEWILRYFAPQKAKEGEVYTPREVIRLMVELLEPRPRESLYDPACGSGGMLIGAYEYLKDKYGKKEADTLFLFGQEVNPKTLALARMNLYIHDIKNAHLELGDTLLYPKFQENGRLKTFDMVIANPPWNLDGYGEESLRKAEFSRERFSFGFPPNQSADWAWIQHMLASSRDRVAVVIDAGCLFRGGKEGAIRRGVVEADLLEGVILLPEKLFYNTGAPGVVLFLRKNKANTRKNRIIFINASQEFEPHPEVKKLNRLAKNNIYHIVDVFRAFREEEGFSRVVALGEIREKDYNLNVTMYVAPKNETEHVDITATWQELSGVERELAEVTGKIEEYLRELGYLRQ